MIPKIIHQIWIQGKDKIPDKFKDNLIKVKTMNKNWEHIIWDEKSIKEFLKQNPIWLRTYNELDHVTQKADYARYVILYKKGGVYLDIDVEVVKPLEGLFKEFPNSSLYVSDFSSNIFENYTTCRSLRCLNNGIIISSIGNPVMKKMVDEINNNHVCTANQDKMDCVNNTTGPFVFNKIVYSTQKSDDSIKILPREYLEPCNFDTCNPTSNTYTIHRHEGSWLTKGKSFGILYHKSKNYITIFCVLLLLSIMGLIIQNYLK